MSSDEQEKRPKRRTAGVFKVPTDLDPCGYPRPKPRDPRGRKSKINPVVTAVLLENIRTGAPLEHCAAAAGVSRSVIYDWLGRGQEDDAAGLETAFAQFFRDVARVRGEWWVATFGKISLGEPGWKGRAWLAERLDPARFAAPPRRLEHSGPGGGGIRIVPATVELPEEIPDGHPSLVQGAALAVTNGVHYANGKSGLDLPPEEDPEAAREDPDDEQ